MQISGSVALVTGANRGLGLAFSRADRQPGPGPAKAVVPVSQPELSRHLLAHHKRAQESRDA